MKIEVTQLAKGMANFGWGVLHFKNLESREVQAYDIRLVGSVGKGLGRDFDFSGASFAKLPPLKRAVSNWDRAAVRFWHPQGTTILIGSKYGDERIYITHPLTRESAVLVVPGGGWKWFSKVGLNRAHERSLSYGVLSPVGQTAGRLLKKLER